MAVAGKRWSGIVFVRELTIEIGGGTALRQYRLTRSKDCHRDLRQRYDQTTATLLMTSIYSP